MMAAGPGAGRASSGRGKRRRIRARCVGVVMVLLSLLLGEVAGATGRVEVQGHRGARGLWPENTLAGFAGALRLGVDVLELDVALSADDVLVVSDAPSLDPDLTRGPGGTWLATEGAAIRSLPLSALRAYDVGRARPGSRLAGSFPLQQPVDGQRIPTLQEVFDLVRRSGADVGFTIEIKMRPGAPSSDADAHHFARRVVDTVRAAGMLERVTVQGFYWATLARVMQLAPEIPIAALTAERSWLDNVQRDRPGASAWTAGLDVDDRGGSVPATVAALGARIWSPYWQDLEAATLVEAHALGLRVVVWTVNDPAAIEAMLALGVDGIISDYPDRVRTAMAARGLPLPAPVVVPQP